MLTAKQFIALFQQWQRGTLGRDEANELAAALKSGEFDQLMEEQIGNDLYEGAFEGSSTKEQMKEDWLLLSEQIKKHRYSKTAHRIYFLKTAWVRYAAAIVVVVAGIALYFNLSNHPHPEKKLTQGVPQLLSRDLGPGSDKAVLILSDGKEVQLNNVSSETIHDGQLSINNNNGQLLYTGTAAVAMNTMTTPKGGQYQISLADGTKVWLNAASSITYPTAFTGKTRTVNITGEAYFEVAKNAAQPFIVNTSHDTITVLGTTFNVHAYPDEPFMKTSLLAGRIRVGKSLILPGHAYENGKVKQTDVLQDIAWKNGLFNFEDASFEQVMRQLSRWYNIDIEYSNGIPDVHLGGEMKRDLSLSQVLRGFARLGVQFRLEGTKLVIIN